MFRKQQHGQTFIEYTLMIGILITALIAMTPMIRRGIQSMVKVTADQVGGQKDADQVGGRFGQLINSTSYGEARQDQIKSERLGETTKEYLGPDDLGDKVYTQSFTYLNQGFAERN